MSFLELRQVEKTYPNGTHAVRGVSLSIAQGEFVVLLGPSGCGKTTTLRMIAGLELATGGSIQLAGRDVTALAPRERDIGFVFQFYALYPHRTVAENVAFPLECVGVSEVERRAAVERVMQRLGIAELARRRPRELSGGDQQRVALARAMVRRPAAWLMDEPLGTLDADRRAQMCDFIRSEQLAERVTTVYVTHDQEEALKLADRIVVMSEGRILQAAPPLEVYDQPATLFVAHFVGSPGMNFLEGEVVVRGERASFRASGGPLELELARTATSGPATLGVRAEFVRLDPRGALRGKVVADEFLGASRSLHVETPHGRLVVRGEAERESSVGQDVGLAFDAAHVRLFDRASGALLQ